MVLLNVTPPDFYTLSTLFSIKYEVSVHQFINRFVIIMHSAFKRLPYSSGLCDCYVSHPACVASVSRHCRL